MNTERSSAEMFRRVARAVADQAGSAWTPFLLALAFVVAWSGLGPHFRYSDTWQLIMNTVSSIVTFLMVFLIQNTQNRDTREIHLKLDELIRANQRARNEFVELERLSDDELAEMEEHFKCRSKEALGAGITTVEMK
jgi:low affinity Fe/Cu permease